MRRRIDRNKALGASSALFLLSPAVASAGTRQTAAATDARVVGRVVTAEGAPAPGVPVGIVETDTGTCFLSCGPGPKTVARTTSRADGRYSGALPRAYVAGTETDADWIVTASRPAKKGEIAGATSSFEFEVNTAVQEAPDLPLWDSTPVASVDGYSVNVSVPGGPLPGTRSRVFLGPATGPEPGAFDLRALEPGRGDQRDASGLTAGASSSADVTVHHSEGRTIYHQRISTPTVAVKEPPLVPPSRGSPCTVTYTDGRSAAARPCAATDGDFSATVRPPEATATSSPQRSTSAGDTTTTTPGVGAVTVELNAATEVESVFVRGCDSSCTVEASSNGSTWTVPRQVKPGSPSVALFQPSVTARLIRVSRPGGSLSVSEISAWPARPPGSPSPPASITTGPMAAPSTGPGPTGPATGVVVRAAPRAPVPRRTRPVGPPILAAFLVGAVGTGAAAVTARRYHRE